MVRKLVALTAALLSSAAAQAEWMQASSEHFVVYDNDTPKNVEEFTRKLETLDRAMRVYHLVPDKPVSPSARVIIFVLGDEGDVQQLAHMHSIAGVYRGRAGDSVALVPRKMQEFSTMSLSSQAVLFHEYSHHFMFSNWGGIVFPKWYVEGFAEFHATAMFKPDGSIIFGAPPNYRTFGVGRADVMPADLLMRPDPGPMDDEDENAFYARGWLLTHYVLLDPAAKAQFEQYLTALNNGKPAAEAEAAFGGPTKVDGKLNTYVHQNFKSVLLTPAQVPVGTVSVRALTPGEAAMMPVFARSKAGVRPGLEAKEVAAEAERLAAPFANDPAAQNALAEAEYDAENYAASEAAADRARAADPKSVHALIYNCLAMQAQAEKNKITEPRKWDEIRSWYLAANRVENQDPRPLILFYQSFHAAKQAPTANAENGLLYAYVLAPFDMSVRMTAAKILLQSNHLPEARVALQVVAYFPEGGDGSEAARKILAALDKDGAKAALDAFPKPEDQDQGKGKDKTAAKG